MAKHAVAITMNRFPRRLGERFTGVSSTKLSMRDLNRAQSKRFAVISCLHRIRPVVGVMAGLDPGTGKSGSDPGHAHEGGHPVSATPAWLTGFPTAADAASGMTAWRKQPKEKQLKGGRAKRHPPYCHATAQYASLLRPYALLNLARVKRRNAPSTRCQVAPAFCA
jgi:hypothetical protein